MKFTSIFFKASTSIFAVCRKGTNKRAKSIKLLEYFHNECKYLSDARHKDNDLIIPLDY